MAMSIEQYHNLCCHQECSFNPEGQRLLWKEEQWAILVNLLFHVHGSFIRTTHCVHNLLQASYQSSPVLEILISYVYFTLHPSFHPAIMPPPSKAIKTVISLFHRQAFHISFRERSESSPYLHGYYTVCMRVKTMGLLWWDHGTSFLRGHSGRHKDNLPAARRTGTVRATGFLGHWAQGCEAGHPQ